MSSSRGGQKSGLPEKQSIEDSLAAVDRFRVARLDDVAGIRAAREVVLSRQRAALAGTRGESDPSVQALDARIAANRAAAKAIATERVRARIPVPVASPEEWVLYGFVRDAEGAGLAGLTVALYVRRVRVEGLDCNATDADGYYLLRVPLGGKEVAGVTVDAAGKKAASREVAIHVLDAQEKCIHAYPDPVAVTPSGVTLLEMTVPTASGKRGRRAPR